MTGEQGAPAGTPRVLHIHGSLARGNPQAERCVRLAEAFGGRLRHTMVAADGDFGACDGLTKGISCERRANFPSLGGLPTPGRLQRIARTMVDYHLVLTYGRAGIGAALAHTSFNQVYPLPPLIHHEDGSDESPSDRRGLWSKWLRRLGLGKSSGVVVPTEHMEAVALVDWQQPMGRVKLILDGVDLGRLAKPVKPDAIPRLLKRSGERWLLCFGDSAPAGNLAAIVASLDALDAAWQLIIAGRVAGRDALDAAIAKRGLDARVHFAPRDARRTDLIQLADLVVLAGSSDPLPLAVIESMAAGKALAGWHDGELAEFFAPENSGFIAQPDPALAAEKIRELASDDELRDRLGAANRAQALAHRDEKPMIAAYRRLYATAMQREAI